jgi:hypothetical protein
MSVTLSFEALTKQAIKLLQKEALLPLDFAVIT